jgi:hypothetical protein
MHKGALCHHSQNVLAWAAFGAYTESHRSGSKEARSSFLKKRSKRLSNVDADLSGESGDSVRKFFGSFFQKRTACLPARGAG